MKIVFVTRKFPPSVGGLETAAYELYSALAKKHDVHLAKWGGSNKFLPVVYPWLFFTSLYLVIKTKPDVLYVQDAMLAPLAVAVKFITRCPVALSVHGLDITYTPALYQKMLKLTVPKLDVIVAGSEWTLDKARERFDGCRIEKITYGVNDIFYMQSSRPDLIKKLSKEIAVSHEELIDAKILLTTGRLVERKGVAWFLENVFPELLQQNPHVLYLVAGDGPDRQKIETIIAAKKLQHNVRLLGYVTPHTRDILYNVCNIFLMPNIPVAGDGEGFGLVAVEAASCGATIVGAKLEGIQDAVTEGKTGYLVRTKKQQDYLKILEREFSKPTLKRTSVRSYVLEHHSWQHIAHEYGAVFATIGVDKG